MEITEKLLKPVIETRYLSVENTDRYRTILRFFFLNYEKLKYWLYQEDVYEELSSHEYFQDYTLDQCQQDLTSLVNWKNLVTIQDTRKVNSIEEFKNKKFRYQLSEYSVEIERLVLKLENLSVEGGSLEPTLLERMRREVLKIDEVLTYDINHTYTWWNDLNNDFIRLNQNYQDYIRDLNSVKAEEMMKSREFLIFKDKLVEYLRNFVRSLQLNSGVIEGALLAIDPNKLNTIIKKVVDYEMSIPRLDEEVNEKLLWERNQGRYESLLDWFAGRNGKEPESEHLFDATNQIIQKMTRYASQISEQTGSNANRKEEYVKVAEMFLKAGSMEEAHCLSAEVFGIDRIWHLQGDFSRATDSANSGVYEENAQEYTITPRIRNYKEKTKRSHVIDRTAEKQKEISRIMEEEKLQRERIQSLIADGKIDFAALPEISAATRDILLQWISKGFEDNERMARTEDGRRYRIDISDQKNRCSLKCEDGIMSMPHFQIIFLEA